MNFASLEYLIFLPIAFLFYWILGAKNRMVQNVVLVVASAVFYCWVDWKMMVLLLLTALSSFAAGWFIDKEVVEGKRKKCLVGALIFNLGVLLYFKYFNFFVDVFADIVCLFGGRVSGSTLRIILPIGISFYTFTALSYVLDIYKRKIGATKDVIAYLAYVMFFPSILSGPISRAQKQLPQYFSLRLFDGGAAVSACRTMLWGGVIKLCLADRIGIYVDAVYSNLAAHSGVTLLTTSLLYSIQIYADFAGYSLMAIGSGRLFGIELQKNFDRPYFSATVTQFWRRWHISLTTWFRDYVYIPLGGNRVYKMRWVANTLIVFLLSGLWHGAAYTFIIWGAIHGICMVVEKFVYGDKIKTITNQLSALNIVRMFITFVIVSFAWIFFRAESLSDAILVISRIFTYQGSLFVDLDTMVYMVGFLFIVLVVDFINEYHPTKFRLLDCKLAIMRWISYLALATMIMLFGVLDGGSFIYFNF